MEKKPTKSELKVQADLILANDKIRKLRSALGRIAKSHKSNSKKSRAAKRAMKG